MKTQEEGVFTIYKDGQLMAIVKRDEVSKKQIVYTVTEASGADIANFIGDKTQEKI